jgi:FAD/FMN-containing dehydrogenase
MAVHLTDEDIARLADSVIGPVFRPGDPGYAGECATYNLLSPLEPVLAVGATSIADVQAAIRFAAGQGTAVAVRGGGHVVARPSGDALLRE